MPDPLYSTPQNNDDWQVAWDEFLATQRTDIGFMQSAWYLNTLLAFGWGYFDSFIAQNTQIQAGARVLIKHISSDHLCYYIPDGPALSSDPVQCEDQFNAILDHCDQIRQQSNTLVSHLRIEPRWTERPAFIDSGHEITAWDEPRDTLYIDLRLSEAEILANMKPKGRYNIKVATRHGVTVDINNSDSAIEAFLQMYVSTLNRKRASALDTEYMRILIDNTIERDCGELYIAQYNSQILAAAFVVYHGDMATYLWAASSDQHKNLMAPYLLNFEIIRHAKTRGHLWYDFYGISPLGDGDNKLDNVTRFKRQFGGVEKRFIPSLDFVYDEPSYRRFRALP